jgi:hypothetical protein
LSYFETALLCGERRESSSNLKTLSPQTKSTMAMQPTDRLRVPLINLAALTPAVHYLERMLSCSSCHKTSDDLHVHKCGGDANYCAACYSRLSHCISCDEPLVKEEGPSLDDIFSSNAARFGGRAPRNMLSLLQDVTSNDDLRLVDRNSAGGQVYFGGDLSRKRNSTGRVGRIRYQHQQERRYVNAKARSPKEDLDFHASQEETPQKGPAAKIVLADNSSQSPTEAKAAPEKENKIPEKNTIVEATTKRSPPRSRKRRRRSHQKDRVNATISETQNQSWTDSLQLPSTNDFLHRMQAVEATTPVAVQKAVLDVDQQSQTRPASFSNEESFAANENSSASVLPESQKVTQNSSQISSLPNSSVSLPNTIDFARTLNEAVELPSGQQMNSEKVSEKRTDQAVGSRKAVISVQEVNERSDSQRMTQDSSSFTMSSFASLPQTMDFEQKLKELATPSRQQPSQATQILTVAVESASAMRAEQLQDFEAAGNVQFIPRICRSNIDLEDGSCAVLPSHLLVEATRDKTCCRTFEYLKAIALGINVVDMDWIADREMEGSEEQHRVWGDSQLWERIFEVKTHDSSPYAWLKSAPWWGTNDGPCATATRSRLGGSDVPLLSRYQVHVLPAHAGNQEQRLLQPDESELLCLLAGAESVISLDGDRSYFNRQGETLVLLVPEHTKSKHLMRAVVESGATIPVGAKLEVVAGTTWKDAEDQAIVVRESWLIDTISAATVAPLHLYCAGLLRW